MAKHVEEPGRRDAAPDGGSRALETIPVLRLDTARRVEKFQAKVSKKAAPTAVSKKAKQAKRSASRKTKETVKKA